MFRWYQLYKENKRKIDALNEQNRNLLRSMCAYTRTNRMSYIDSQLILKDLLSVIGTRESDKEFSGALGNDEKTACDEIIKRKSPKGNFGEKIAIAILRSLLLLLLYCIVDYVTSAFSAAAIKSSILGIIAPILLCFGMGFWRVFFAGKLSYEKQSKKVIAYILITVCILLLVALRLFLSRYFVNNIELNVPIIAACLIGVSGVLMISLFLHFDADLNKRTIK